MLSRRNAILSIFGKPKAPCPKKDIVDDLEQLLALAKAGHLIGLYGVGVMLIRSENMVICHQAPFDRLTLTDAAHILLQLSERSQFG